MVKKIIIPGLIIIVAFLSLFFGLSQIDWVTEFNVKQVRSSSENKIGELIWDEISSTEQVNTNDSIIKTLDKLFKTWKPREKYEFINTNEVKDKVVPHKLVY